MRWFVGKSGQERLDRRFPIEQRHRPAFRRLTFEWLERREVLTAFTWIGGASGVLTVGENWADGDGLHELPGADDTAIFTGQSAYDISYEGDVDFGSIVVHDGELTVQGSGLLRTGTMAIGNSGESASLDAVGASTVIEATHTLSLANASRLSAVQSAAIYVGETLDTGVAGQLNATGGIISVGALASESEARAPADLAAKLDNLGSLVLNLSVAARDLSINVKSEESAIDTSGNFTPARFAFRYNEGSRGDVASNLFAFASYSFASSDFTTVAPNLNLTSNLAYDQATGKLKMTVPTQGESNFNLGSGVTLRAESVGAVTAYAQVAQPGQAYDPTLADGQLTFVADSQSSVLNFTLTVTALNQSVVLDEQVAGSLSEHVTGEILAQLTKRTGDTPAKIRFLDSSHIDAVALPGLFLPGPDFQGSGVQVLQNGVLQGAGTIEGDVTNDGTIRIGDEADAATLVLANGFHQTQFGTLVIDVHSEGAADKLQVAGDAQFDNGNTLSIVVEDDLTNVDTPFTVVTAGSLTANLTNVQGNSTPGTYLRFQANTATSLATLTPIHSGLDIVKTDNLTSSEAGQPTGFQVRLLAPPAADVRVFVGSLNSNEGAVSAPAGGFLTFTTSNWDSLQTVTIAGVDDALVDGSQPYLINLRTESDDAAYNGLADRQIPVVNNDNDGSITSISIGDVSANEGNSGQTPFEFVIALSHAEDSPVTVAYTTESVTAIAGIDFESATGQLTFQPGQTSLPLAINVLGNTTFQSNRTFKVVLSDPVGDVTLGDADAVGTIVDDDPLPTLSIADARQAEGTGTSATSFAFTVTLSQASPQTVSVQYATEVDASDLATPGVDFAAATGSVIFAPGETTKTITVNVAGDALEEANETFHVRLSNAASAALDKKLGQGTILNDDHTNELPSTPTPLNLIGGFGKVSGRVDVGQSGELIDFLLASLKPGQSLPGDWDFYSFHLDQTTTERIEIIAARLGAPLDAVLSLQKQTDNGLQVVATNFDTVGLDPVIQMRLDAGDYIVGVAGEHLTAGDYHLQFSSGIPPKIGSAQPNQALPGVASTITVLLGGESLDADSVRKDAFQLLSQGFDVSSLLGTPRYDATLNRIEIPFTAPAGVYNLIVKDAITGDGLHLDGDNDGIVGGDFRTTFSISDSTAGWQIDAASLRIDRVIDTDGSTMRLAFSGTIRGPSPLAFDTNDDGVIDSDDAKSIFDSIANPLSTAGYQTNLDTNQDRRITVDDGLAVLNYLAGPTSELHVDLGLGVDGQFDDGTKQLTISANGRGLSENSGPLATGIPAASFAIDSTASVPIGSGNQSVRFRLTNGAGTVLSTATLNANTDLPLVASVRPTTNDPQAGNQSGLKVVFTRSVVQNITSLSSYQVDLITPSGPVAQTIQNVVSTDGRSAVIVLDSLPEGVYRVRVRSAQDAIHVVGIGGAKLLLDGDLDGQPGGDAVVTVSVDNQAPIITRLRVDNRLAGNALVTSSLIPNFTIDASDNFPAATEQLAVQLIVDGQSVSGQLPLAGSGISGQLTLPAPQILSEGPHVVVLRATDASGNVSEQAYTVTVDRRGPSVLPGSQTVALARDSAGVPTGLVRIAFAFDGELDPAAASNKASYQLIAAGADRDLFNISSDDDRSDLITAVYAPGDPQTGRPPIVTITANLASVAGDEFQLIVRGQSITDLAGNPLLGGNYRVPFQFDTRTTTITSVRPARTSSDQPLNLVIVQFDGPVLNFAQIENPANYLLQSLVGAASTIAINSIEYDELINRVVITTRQPLTGGSFRLTINGPGIANEATGINSHSGLALDGDGDGLPGGTAVRAFSTSDELSTTAVLDGNQNALAQFVNRVMLDASASRKTLTSAGFAGQLLDQVASVTTIGRDSAQIATEINENLSNLLLAAELALRADAVAQPGQYIVLWGRGTRFLVYDPTDDPASATRRRLGFDGSDIAIQEIPGAVLVSRGTGSDKLSLAILPVTGSNRLASNNLTTVAGIIATLGVTYQFDLQGLAQKNEAGYLLIGNDGQAISAQFVDVGQTIQAQTVRIEGADAIDANVKLINDRVRAAIEAIYGSLDHFQGTLLFAWFDPVDYVLSDAQGDSTGATGGQPFALGSGGYSFTNGATGLIVIPNALAGLYSLELGGLGTSYRGGLNFVDSSGVTFVPLQGALGAADGLVAQVDFRRAGDTATSGNGGSILSGISDVSRAALTQLLSSGSALGFGNSAATSLLASNSLLNGNGPLGPLRLNGAGLATHVGRHGAIVEMVRQLSGSMLRSLQSLRSKLAKEAGQRGALQSLDRLIDTLSGIDPTQLDSVWQLEPRVGELVENLDATHGIAELELQLKVMRALREAAAKLHLPSQGTTSEGPAHRSSAPVESPSASERSALNITPTAADQFFASESPRIEPDRYRAFEPPSSSAITSILAEEQVRPFGVKRHSASASHHGVAERDSEQTGESKHVND